MYKVIAKFKDILNPQHIYNVGDEFDSDDINRVNNLLERKLVEESEEEESEEEPETNKKTKSK